MSDLLERDHIHPDVRFTTWEDFAIMAMVEKDLGASILPNMLLRRIPYEIEIRPLQRPYFRQIGLVMKDRSRLAPVVKKFMEYLPFREEAE